MAVKAIAKVDQLVWKSTSTFGLLISYLFLPDTDSAGSFEVDGLSPSILSVTLESTIKDAVKDRLGISGLDTVRLIGATI